MWVAKFLDIHVVVNVTVTMDRVTKLIHDPGSGIQHFRSTFVNVFATIFLEIKKIPRFSHICLEKLETKKFSEKDVIKY